jgi:hypothetical protein
MVVVMPLLAQTPTATSDADQIAALMAGLSHHSQAPAGVLDPNLSPADREKNLRRLSAPNYELSLVAEGNPAITGDTASVPIRVRFDDKEGDTLDTSATANFVKRGERWYFSNFDFMAWPAFLVVVLVGGILVGIAYATTVLVLWTKLSRRGQLGVNGVKVLFPIFWPSLFRQARSPDVGANLP